MILTDLFNSKCNQESYCYYLTNKLFQLISYPRKLSVKELLTRKFNMKKHYFQVCIYNIEHGTYNYAAGNYDAQDDDRRNVFRWTEGNAAYDSLWRIIDKEDGSYAIYSEYWGEYLYASESTYSDNRRYIDSHYEFSEKLSVPRVEEIRYFRFILYYGMYRMSKASRRYLNIQGEKPKETQVFPKKTVTFLLSIP